jgi:glycosyltransferase involved in cell wall biosynthesis
VKITFLVPHLRIAGGIRVILTYADRLGKRGHDVTLVVPAKSQLRALWRYLTRQCANWYGPVQARVRWVSTWTPGALPEGDVIVATAWRSATTVAEAPRACGEKFYLIQGYESLHLGPPDLVDATYRLPLRKVVVSTWLRDLMRDQFGTDAELIPPSVDQDLFHPRPTAVGAPRGAGAIVLMMDHRYAFKGVVDGLEAVSRVRPRVAQLRLVGFGVKPSRWRSQYHEFHVSPPQTQLAALYRKADVFLCPSWNEGLGLPSMEAMASGAALVTYDNGGCRDYALDGETAFVAPNRDVGALAAKLELAVADAALRMKMATNGERFIRTRFHWDSAVTRLEQLFEQAQTSERR